MWKECSLFKKTLQFFNFSIKNNYGYHKIINTFYLDDNISSSSSNTAAALAAAVAVAIEIQ